MLFLPVEVTAITTSTLFPQLLHSLALLLEPALAATSVFDFPDMFFPSFNSIYLCIKSAKICCRLLAGRTDRHPVRIRHAQKLSLNVSTSLIR